MLKHLSLALAILALTAVLTATEATPRFAMVTQAGLGQAGCTPDTPPRPPDKTTSA